MSNTKYWKKIVEDAQDFQSDIKEMIAWAKTQGVDLDIDVENQKLYLVEISRRVNSPRGAGAKVMERLCGFADDHGLEIVLHVAGGSKGLVAYYERFGFEAEYEDEHDQADEDSFGYEVFMFREPR